VAPLIVTVAAAIVASFLCSLSEACLLSMSLADIARIGEAHPRSGRIWRAFYEDMQKPMSVILIINTFANAAGAAIAASRFTELFGAAWIMPFSIGFSLVIIQWGEILPKTLGVRYNMRVARAIGLPLKILAILLAPFISVAEFINRPFDEKQAPQGTSADAASDITALARFAAINRMISGQQERIVARGMNLARRTVKDIMSKRNEIKYLSATMRLGEAMIEAHLHHHTRYPLVREHNLDQIEGYINFKDIVAALRINPKDPSLRGIVRPIIEFRPNENLAVVLQKMTREHRHIAVVKEESGATVGLITMEDVIECVIGDIQDEYDVLPNYFYAIADGRYLAGGAVTVGAVSEKAGGTTADPNMTLNAWMRAALKHVPQIEERLTLGSATITVRKVRRSKVFEATIDVPSAPKPAAPTAQPPDADAGKASS
jgi:putative hemolysin